MSDGVREVFMWIGIGVCGIVFALGVLFIFCIIQSLFDGGGAQRLPPPKPPYIPSGTGGKKTVREKRMVTNRQENKR